jgi:hypothetical protein
LATRGWREPHGKEGGETGADSDLIERAFANVGAVIMGRRTLSADDGPRGDEPWEGWWGDDPPFRVPVYVLTIQPYLRADAIDELTIQLVPLFLGGGTRLFEDVPAGAVKRIEVVDSPAVTHISYRLESA